MGKFPEIHQRMHVVRHHECGANGNIKLQLLMDCLQDAAAEHAEKLGCGMEDLVDDKRIWVLSRLKIRILRFPKLKDELQLLTYPSGHDRLMAYRQYAVLCGNEEIVQGSSAWVMLDGTTYRPLAMEKVFSEPLPANEDRPRYFEKFDKFSAPAGEAAASFQVGAGDIDLNCHLNNAVYGRYIEQVLDRVLPGAHQRIFELQINFQHAGQLNDVIGCTGCIEKNDFLIGGGKYFAARGVLKEV